MRPLISLLAAACVVGSASASQEVVGSVRRPIRIPVYHADPWMIKAMLEGQPIRSPEISTVLLAAGMNGGAAQGAQQAANQGMALFWDGFFMVNPTDNNLWFYPNKKS